MVARVHFTFIDHILMPCWAWVVQKQFSELLMKAASDYGALTSSVADFQWSQNFKEPPTVWGVSRHECCFPSHYHESGIHITFSFEL